MDSKDRLAESKLKELIKSAELEYQTLTISDGDTSNWLGHKKRVTDSLKAAAGELNWGRNRTKQLADNMMSGWDNIFTKEAELGIVKRNKNDAIKVTAKDYVSSLSSLDSSERQQLMVGRNEELYRAALGTTFSPARVDMMVASAKEDGAKGRAINMAIDGQFAEAKALIDRTKFDDPKDRVAMTNSINAMEAKAIAGDRAAVEAELKAIDDVVILPAEEFLDAVPDTLDRINKSTILPVKGKNGAGKEGQRKKINDRVKAIREGKIDPIYEFDFEYYNQLSARIAENPRSVSEGEINRAAGRGKNRGITAGKDGQQGALIKLKRFLQGVDPSVHRTYTVGISGLKSAKAFSKSKKLNNKLAAEAQILLDTWATEETRTREDYQDFYNGLIDTIAITGDGLVWKSRKAEAQIASENMAKFVEDFVGVDAVRAQPKQYKDGDKRTVNGVVYTFDGKVWQD